MRNVLREAVLIALGAGILAGIHLYLRKYGIDGVRARWCAAICVWCDGAQAAVYYWREFRRYLVWSRQFHAWQFRVDRWQKVAQPTAESSSGYERAPEPVVWSVEKQ